MRKNLPVTNIETSLPDNQFIYSRTDLKGVITEANEAFCNVSGYTREEMVGQPHNMVRHPDMPEAAFKDMWADLKTGRPWRGIVKNRRKDGGFYWVVANVSPVRENGQIVGYQSVRSRPSREEIEAATAAYEKINRGSSSLVIIHGHAVYRHSALVKAMTSLRGQTYFLGFLVLLLGCIDLSEVVFSLDFGWVHEALMGLAIAYAIYFVGFFVPKLSRDLDKMADWTESLLTTGNLKRRLLIRRSDMLGSVVNRMDAFVSSVQATVQGMADTARHVAESTSEVEAGMHVVHRSAEKQSEATSAAAAAVEEVTVSIGEVAEHAYTTKEVALNTGDVSREGAKRSGEACATITALAGTVKESAEKVETLGQRSAEISHIAGEIKEIADQTNLLALNAAIEAARAGEQGRGFAVVADEVRKLAERTGRATQQISSMIDLIQQDTQRAVEGMRSGASQVEEGVSLVHSAQDALQKINDEMSDTIQRVNEISHASDEQREAMTLLAQNVEQVASMTEQNVAVVTQTESMVGRLTSIVERMNKSVNQFTV
ncbi:MAG: methyl-accepting chemotaxis protein [Propionivibrio sp.]|uniref:methyl-accepting chemotaxis protein n=1 Tax=Propionivibrio sp. TaxID=2212460 RepID=UPI001B3D8DE5|nr:PAS domain-containing methyl-accepting chemotaxis protein [Propionivibrio sp.]MBP7202368.1 methyl-accepting chemotaxis protein [Propionivibrio sp.]